MASTAVRIVACPLIITTVAPGIELAKLFQRFHPVHAGHLHVEKNEVRPPLLVFGYAVGRVRDRVYFVALVLEELTERRADSLLIVDDQNPSTHFTLL